MADEVGNANIPMWQTGLAQAINETYTYQTNALFYALVPEYTRPYCLKYIRPACQWLDGYVPSLHQNGYSGIISTRIGNALITGLTKQVVGERIIFRLASKDDPTAKDTMQFVSKWYEEQNIYKPIYAGIGFALGIGTSLIKMNKTIDGKIWWEAVRFDNCFYRSNFHGDVQDATFVIRGYADTRKDHSNCQWFLVEHRYYRYCKVAETQKDEATGLYSIRHKKGDYVPMVCYEVHKTTGTMLNDTITGNVNSVHTKWAEVPQFLRDNLKDDYSILRLDEEEELGFMDLGVVPLLNGEIDLSVPRGSMYGESMLIKVQSDMISYETALSYKLRDMYLGKGTVYQPKSLTMDDMGAIPSPFGSTRGVMQNIGEDKIELLKGVDPEQQKIVVNQFAIRGEEWQKIMDDSLRNIATKWGMSPKILSSYLANGIAQQTATQVDSEDDISIAFIYHTRAYFKNAINKLLETTLNFYGKPANVTIDFASPSLINKDRLLERVIKELENGLIDMEEAIRTLNPDLDEEVIQQKTEKAITDREKAKLDSISEMNFDGTFGNFDTQEQEQPSADFLKGSTAI